MTTELMSQVIFAAGLAQAGILAASVQVPSALRWREELRPLPRLHRQMHWVYGGYVVLSIVAFAAISLTNARELAAGGALARGVCAYIAVFWGIRLCLQAVFDLRPYLTTPMKRAGATILTVLFALLTVIYGFAALAEPIAARSGPFCAPPRVEARLGARLNTSGASSTVTLGVPAPVVPPACVAARGMAASQPEPATIDDARIGARRRMRAPVALTAAPSPIGRSGRD